MYSNPDPRPLRHRFRAVTSSARPVSSYAQTGPAGACNEQRGICDIRPVRIHGQQPLPVERLGFRNDVVISKTTLRRRTHACAARFPDITAGLRGAPAVGLTSPVTAALATRK